tara:strand:+ start:599 stop:796 length:198 start_codon:yes stop_codon:yes gene_type:complete
MKNETNILRRTIPKIEQKVVIKPIGAVARKGKSSPEIIIIKKAITFNKRKNIKLKKVDPNALAIK